MNKNIKLLFFIALFLVTITTNAQVTIGSEAIPNAGSLLDLKQNTNTGVNSIAGLGLPRVTLKKKKPTTPAELSSSIGGTGNWDLNEHIGLVIYNVSDNVQCGMPTGPFVWDGVEWTYLFSDDSSDDSTTSLEGDYNSDIEALKELYNANPSNTLGWDMNNDPSTWSGVTIVSVCGEKRVTNLSVNSRKLTVSTGIEKLYALKELYCGYNQLTSLNVSNNIELTNLACSSNQLTSLDLSRNVKLTNLACSSNQLTTLDLSNNTILKDLECNSNKLTNLNVTNVLQLGSIKCSGNQLTNLDLSDNINLTNFLCYSNKLTNLDISKNTKLTFIACNVNQLTNLDVSKNTELRFLTCNSNQLTNFRACLNLIELS